MYSISLYNTDAHLQELRRLGVKEAMGFCSTAPFIQIHLNLKAFISTVMYDDIYSPLVNIEDVAPMLMLGDLRARVEYLQSYGLYSINTYVRVREILETL